MSNNPDNPNLSAKAKRNIIINSLSRLISEQNPTQTAALQYYKQQGLGIRQSDFSRIYKATKSGFVGQEILRVLPENAIPSKDILKPSNLTSTAFPIPQNYRFIGEVRIVDKDTGEIYSDDMGIDTNDLMSISEIEDAIATAYAGAYPKRMIGIKSVHILRGYYHSDTPHNVKTA